MAGVVALIGLFVTPGGSGGEICYNYPAHSIAISMPDLQDVFKKTKAAKKERKKINDMYREALMNSKTYTEILDQLKELQAKKKRFELQTKQDFRSEMENLDKLKQEIQSSNILMSDIALTTLMKGQTVAITDEDDVKYEPQFTVKFKKTQ